jgi:hypothetical protein
MPDEETLEVKVRVPGNGLDGGAVRAHHDELSWVAMRRHIIHLDMDVLRCD